MNSTQDKPKQPDEHPQVWLMRHLLTIGVNAISESSFIPDCSTPRIQAHFAREGLWLIDVACGLSTNQRICKRFVCGKENGQSYAIPLPRTQEEAEPTSFCCDCGKHTDQQQTTNANVTDGL